MNNIAFNYVDLDFNGVRKKISFLSFHRFLNFPFYRLFLGRQYKNCYYVAIEFLELSMCPLALCSTRGMPELLK